MDVILFVLFYAVIGIILVALVTATDFFTDDVQESPFILAAIVLVWPVVLILAILLGLGWVVGRIVQAIAGLWKKTDEHEGSRGA